ncbi:MAG TPA: alpha/beta hydrolase [Tepidisphaeraceae bacterium]|nr:alpha/beta hydrolase [Tepidisphaeraceae bacterium]
METVVESTARPNARPARWRGIGWRVVRSALLIYLGVSLVLSMMQTMMIFPGTMSQGTPASIVRPDPSRELLELKTPDGQRVAACFGQALTIDGTPHPHARTKPTILYFYGNGMCMADAIGEFTKLRRLGNNVIVCDYLGYGMSSGKPSETGCYAAAEAVWEHAINRPDIDKAKIVPMGWSLGAGAAIELASTKPVAALGIFSPFTSVADMARRVMPFFPTSLLLRHRFDNETKLAKVTCPILIMHGTRDAIIPFEMSQRLARIAGHRATFEPVAGADHNDLFDVGGEEMFQTIGRFLESLKQPPPAPAR